jgi:hypothetical protein
VDPGCGGAPGGSHGLREHLIAGLVSGMDPRLGFSPCPFDRLLRLRLRAANALR